MEKHSKFVKVIQELASQSTCWLGVGCVAVRDGQVIARAYNEVLPDPQVCNKDGCLRKKKNLSGGEGVEDCFAIHAEVNLIAQAARAGLVLEGADIYVTCFPCAVCAKALVQAGIARVFFLEDFLGRKGEVYFSELNTPPVRVGDEVLPTKSGSPQARRKRG